MLKQVDKNLLLDTANVFESLAQQYIDAGHRWADSEFLQLMADTMDELTGFILNRDTSELEYSSIIELVDAEGADGIDDAQ